MSNIWVCRTGDYMTEFFKQKLAGFHLHDINPLKFRSEDQLRGQIIDELAEETRGKNYNGRTFAGQIWDISHNVAVGDWIYLDHPNIGDKPRAAGLKPGQKGKQRSFIVAAGIVTGGYKYAPKHGATHQVKVDWKWRGQVLIDYGFQSQIFVHIDSRHPKVLADLKRIWSPKSGGLIEGKGNLATPVPAVTDQTSIDRDWEEGAVVLKTHLSIERSQAAAKAAKEQARKRGKGTITCSCCGKEPEDIYGVEIIDAHHIVPLKDTKGMARAPVPADFEMLCPTCHRAVHHALAKGYTEGRDAIEEVRLKVLRKS